MFIIEYTSEAVAISKGLDLELNAGITTVTIDRSVNGLIRIIGGPLAFGGQLDIADLAGRPNQPMLIEAITLVSTNVPGVNALMGVMGPLEPGNIDNTDRELGGFIFGFGNSPAILDVPILIPSQHRFGIDMADGPLRVMLQCREFLAGELEDRWAEGNPTI
jgi:hypothetical protein